MNPTQNLSPAPARLARWVRCLAAAAAACATLAPAPAPAPAPRPDAAQAAVRSAFLDQQRKQREMQFESQKRVIAAMQPLKVKHVDEALRMKMEGRSLAATSPLAGDNRAGSFRLDSDLFKGPTTVSLYNFANAALLRGARVAQPPGAGVSQMFTLVSYDMPSPDELTTLTVQLQPGYLQIDRNSQSGAGGYRLVRLMQQRPADGQGAAGGVRLGFGAGVFGPAAGGVQLLVSESGDIPEPRNFNLQVADFQSLLREHAREADEFVRPLLRQLGQESVLAPDEFLAWQVFSDHWQPDPETTRKVREILPSMNDPDFRARDKALAALRATGKAGAAALLHLDRSSLTPEQNLLIDRALAPFAQLPPRDAARLAKDADFLLDCLYGADHDLRSAALDRLKTVEGRDVPFDLDAPDAERAAAVSALRRQLADPHAPKPTTEPVKS